MWKLKTDFSFLVTKIQNVSFSERFENVRKNALNIYPVEKICGVYPNAMPSFDPKIASLDPKLLVLNSSKKFRNRMGLQVFQRSLNK